MLNFIVIAIYLILLLIFSNLSHKRFTNKEFTLAGRKMRTFPVLISILATETSAASLLLFPDLGFNPAQRFIFLQLVAGMAVGRLLSAYLLIGPIYRSGRDSIYEILADLLSENLAKMSAALYTIATILAAGVRLFIGAIALSILLSAGDKTSYLQVAFFILLAGSIAVYYSRQGGLKGVIYTDNLQFLLIIIALFAILFTSIGSIDFTFLRLGNFIKLTPGPGTAWYSYTYSLPLAFIGGIVLSLGSHGIDQTTVQRVLAQRNEKEARRSVIYSSIVIIPFIFLFLLCGFIIAQINDAGEIFNQKQYIYPWYLNSIHHGSKSDLSTTWLVALTSVAFLSASMSSIDSALHSIATSLKQTKFKFARNIPLTRLTVISGTCLVISALVFQFIKSVRPDALLVSLALGATGMIFSPMASLYIMIYHFPDRTKNRFQKNRIAVISLLSGIICNLVVFGLNNIFSGLNISWLLSLVLSFIITAVIYGVGVSLKSRSVQV